MVSPEKSKFYADTVRKAPYGRNELRKDAFAHRKSQKKVQNITELIQKVPQRSPSNSSEFSRENTNRKFDGDADVSSDDLNLSPVPLFEQSFSTFKSEVFDSANKFEGMKIAQAP